MIISTPYNWNKIEHVFLIMKNTEYMYDIYINLTSEYSHVHSVYMYQIFLYSCPLALLP